MVTTYTFTTLDDQADPTFNQLLGINGHHVIAGYFGSGADPQHPNKGYLLKPPYGQGNYASENFPGSAQTQVTGLNNLGDTSGFWVTGNGTNHGFVEWNGVFASFNDPNTPHMKGSVNQLLGINDNGAAVGFYTDAAGQLPRLPGQPGHPGVHRHQDPRRGVRGRDRHQQRRVHRRGRHRQQPRSPRPGCGPPPAS